MKSYITILTLVSLAFTACSDKSRIGYINNQEVYDNFTLTKELGTQYDVLMGKAKRQLDSIQNSLDVLAEKLNTQKNPAEEDIRKYQLLREEYLMKKEELASQGQSLQEEYNKQIFSQMNEYVNAFGKEKHYRYVLGATGQGNVMYADSTENCTKEVIAYINNKYKGIIK